MQSGIEEVFNKVPSKICDSKNMSKLVNDFIEYNVYQKKDYILGSYRILYSDSQDESEDEYSDWENNHIDILYIIPENRTLIMYDSHCTDKGKEVRPSKGKIVKQGDADIFLEGWEDHWTQWMTCDYKVFDKDIFLQRMKLTELQDKYQTNYKKITYSFNIVYNGRHYEPYVDRSKFHYKEFLSYFGEVVDVVANKKW